MNRDFGPGEYFYIRRSGGLDLTSSLEAKFGARSGQVHQAREKIWEVLSPQDAKVGEKFQFWGQIWNSEGKIWGTCHLYFWRQNLGLQQEFQRQILGPSAPDLLIWKYPLGISVHTGNICSDIQGACVRSIRLECHDKYFLVWTSSSINKSII